jgi:hypothetical protein
VSYVVRQSGLGAFIFFVWGLEFGVWSWELGVGSWAVGVGCWCLIIFVSGVLAVSCALGIYVSSFELRDFFQR